MCFKTQHSSASWYSSIASSYLLVLRQSTSDTGRNHKISVSQRLSHFLNRRHVQFDKLVLPLTELSIPIMNIIKKFSSCSTMKSWPSDHREFRRWMHSTLGPPHASWQNLHCLQRLHVPLRENLCLEGGEDCARPRPSSRPLPLPSSPLDLRHDLT